MAPESTVLTTKVTFGSPYQLDKNQILRASTALLKHIKTSAQQEEASSTTKSLLAAGLTSADSLPSEAEPIWLILTSKKFITNHPQLKPRKIAVPHPLYTSPHASICLITPEPQRQFKDAIAHPSFPHALATRITRIISVKKLEAKYHSFESKRQLRDSHDIFLADDRIISYLVRILGKTFYKSTPKRPIPVSLQPSKPKEKKNAALLSTKPKKEISAPKSVIAPQLIAKEIEHTLCTTQLHLMPSTTTAIKVGFASMITEEVTANIEAVMASLTNKSLIAWRNIRALHIKGPNTMALPVWLAEELWTGEDMVLEDDEVAAAQAKMAQKGKKRRALAEAPKEDGDAVLVKAKESKDVGSGEKEDESRRKKAKRAADEDMNREMKERRDKLRKQKKEAREMIERGEGKADPKRAAVDAESVSKERKS